jgi:hypothetical protein
VSPIAAKTYAVYNSAQVTTAAPVKQPTGTTIRTMMQLAPAVNTYIRVIEWGCSFDGSAAATPGEVELFVTTVGATMSTGYNPADIQCWSDGNAPANTSGTGGIPLNLGTSLSGFATTTVTESTVVNARMLDAQLIAPTSQYAKQFPLGREPELGYGNTGNGYQTQVYLRVRMTFGTSVNAYIYVIFEV